jgi:hypothetical protein
VNVSSPGPMQLLKPPLFVRERQELDKVLLRANLLACPHCGRAGMLIGHGFVKGYCAGYRFTSATLPSDIRDADRRERAERSPVPYRVMYQ